MSLRIYSKMATNLVRISGLVTPCSGSVKYTPRVAMNCRNSSFSEEVLSVRLGSMPLLPTPTIFMLSRLLQGFGYALGPCIIVRENIGSITTTTSSRCLPTAQRDCHYINAFNYRTPLILEAELRHVSAHSKRGLKNQPGLLNQVGNTVVD